MMEEEPVEFSSSHYPNGLNADFFQGNSSAEDLIEKFAGKGGGGGKFEDSERRDIAAAVPEIMELITGTLSLPRDATVLDVGAGTGLLIKHLSSVLPSGSVIASELSPDFRCWLSARIATEGLQNVRVVEATPRDPLPTDEAAVNLALMVDVYHHLVYPRSVCRRLRNVLRSDGLLVVLDFHRDPSKVTSRPPEWVLGHIRAGQDTFRNEILGCGYVLAAEPDIPALKENYCMVFRPATSDELATAVGSGWADKPIPIKPTTRAEGNVR